MTTPKRIAFADWFNLAHSYHIYGERDETAAMVTACMIIQAVDGELSFVEPIPAELWPQLEAAGWSEKIDKLRAKLKSQDPDFVEAAQALARAFSNEYLRTHSVLN
jgi:hypothetical protein